MANANDEGANIREVGRNTSVETKNQHLGKVFKRIWTKNSYIIALFILLIVAWGIGFVLFKDDVMGVNSQLFSLMVLFVSAKIIGVLMGFLYIPPLVGMLLTGVLLKNVGYLDISGSYSKFTAVLRQLALVNIMLPAGLGLDASTLKKMFLMILNLSTVPVAVEVAAITITSYFFLEFEWMWGILLGLLLAAVSPAVIIPCLFELQDKGYGVNKGIHTLVIAASTLNDIICIALFGIFIGLIFSSGSITMQILQGPISVAIGLIFGVIWGIICSFVPYREDEYLCTLRTLMLGLGCVLAPIASEAIGYGGAGALGCITAAFVASLFWKKQGWDNNNPVRKNFVLLWKFFEPISFALIGMEVDFSILKLDSVLWGILITLISLLLRIVTSFATTQCTNLNQKENLFVALSWIPKATVQAALGPVALDMARSLDDQELIADATTVVIIAVISILLTSPIGAVIIMQLGPKFLHRTLPENQQFLNEGQETNDIERI